MSGAEAVARPKKGEKKKPQKPVAGGDRVAIINLKGSEEYAEWLDRLYRKTHIAKATIVRLALEEYAKNHQHEPPPEI